MTGTPATRSESRRERTHWLRRSEIALTACCAALVACGPSGAPDAGTEVDVGSDAATGPSDAGADASEPPDAASAELVLWPARLELELAAPGCARSGELTLSNEGNAHSGPLSFAIVGLDASQFALASHDCPEALAAGARCVITVELRPADTGWFEASLEVEASDRVATAELRAMSAHDGCGWPPTSTPRFVEFGDVVVGTTSAPQTVTVYNRGGGAFEPLRVELTGPSAASFSLARDTCSGVALAGGFTCEIEIVVLPSSPGALSASLDVSAGAAMTSVPLTGTAVLSPPAAFVESGRHRQRCPLGDRALITGTVPWSRSGSRSPRHRARWRAGRARRGSSRHSQMGARTPRSSEQA